MDDPSLIKFVPGVRCCGKSCLMETVADELKEWGIAVKDIVYLDLANADCAIPGIPTCMKRR